VIVLGNDFVLKTYTDYDTEKSERYKNLNAFYYDINNTDLNKKNFKEAKKHFLWFGSTGSLHKGLDILIEIFSNRNDIILHICGMNKNENNFIKFYEQNFNKCKNIINHGFVKIKSKNF
jgi:hypothetical protein